MLATEFRVAVSPVLASPVLRRLLPAFAVSAVGGGGGAGGGGPLRPRPRPAGSALLSGLGMAGLVIGPLLAGLAVAAAGPALPIAADAASFAILAVAAATVRGHPATAGSADAGEPGR